MRVAHSKLSAFYLQLRQKLGAGLKLASPLETPSPAPDTNCTRRLRLIHDGEPVARMFAATGYPDPIFYGY